MLLVALVFSIFCHSQNNKERTKELLDRHFQLSLELDDIGKKITASYDFLHYLQIHYAKLQRWAVDNTLQNMKNIDPDQEDTDAIKKQIGESIKNELVSISNDLHQAYCGKSTFDHDLIQELFVYKNIDTIDIFDTLKFCWIRVTTGRFLLWHLVTSYEVCLKKILAISQELASLEEHDFQTKDI